MRKLPDLIEAYVDAYNRKDVEVMLSCLADNAFFQNIVGGEVTAEASDKRSLAQLAKLGAGAFEARHQEVTNAITVAGTTLIEVSYSAVVAIDLPNGWKAGQTLAFSSASAFRVEGGKIISIVDES